MGTESVYQIWQFNKTKCFVGISREGLTRKRLMKTSCLHLVLTLRISVMCRAHASLHGKLTSELPVKTALVFNCLESLHIHTHTHTLSLSLSLSHTHTHTTLINKSHMKYRVHKIEHNYNQIWHGIKASKNIVVNYNFIISPFGYSVTKPLKQTLDLNLSLGIVVKLTPT